MKEFEKFEHALKTLKYDADSAAINQDDVSEMTEKEWKFVLRDIDDLHANVNELYQACKDLMDASLSADDAPLGAEK